MTMQMVLWSTAILFLWHATAWGQSAFESPPTLPTRELAPSVTLQGPRYRVAEQASVKWLLGQFTITSDFGELRPVGADVLGMRVAEMAALETLEKSSKTQEFLKAAGTAAARPVKAGAHMLMNPKETAQGFSAGASRFFDRMKAGGQHIAEGASTSGQTSEQKAEEVSRRVGSTTVDVFGWEEERRALAKRLHVDPYTTNPILSEKMSDFTWVTFSGRVGLNAVVSVVVPGSIFLTATSVTNDMVWDLKPGDVLKVDAQKLAAAGAPESAVQALVKNQWYSLTTLTWLANGLEGLAGVAGRADVVAFAATAADEHQARYIATALNMLAAAHAKSPLATIGAHGTLIGRTQAGGVIVPAPVDYIAWTQGVANFARRVDLQASDRAVWTTGKLSPRATKELTALGWTVRQAAPIAPPAVLLPTTSR